MSYFVRLKRRSRLPAKVEATEAICAAADGTRKHMDPEGTVTTLAGAGSLPDPTSEGAVLTVVSGDWAGAAPSGSSQPTIIEQTITAAELADRFDAGNGVSMIEITEVQVGDILEWVLWRDSTLDGDFALNSGPARGYTSGESSATVYDQADQGSVSAIADSGSTFLSVAAPFVTGVDRVTSGALYLEFDGATPPTTGTVTVAIGIRRPL